MKKLLFNLPIIVLTGFALITLFLSSSVIFDMFGIRAKEGNYVLFVVWSNFISSVLYIFAAYNWYKLKPLAYKLLGSSTLILIAAQIALYSHISSGGIYEEKTVKAMFFRTSIWLLILTLTLINPNYLKKQKS